VTGFPTACKLATVTLTLAGRAFGAAGVIDEELVLVLLELELDDDEVPGFVVVVVEVVVVVVVVVVVPLPVLDDEETPAFVVVLLVLDDAAAPAIVAPAAVAVAVVPCATAGCAGGISGISSENASVCADRSSSVATSGSVNSSGAWLPLHAANAKTTAKANRAASMHFMRFMVYPLYNL